MEPPVLNLSDIEDHSSEVDDVQQAGNQAQQGKDGDQPAVLSLKAQQKINKKMKRFNEDLKIIEQYFKAGENAVQELRQTQDSTENALQVDKRHDKKRQQALNAGQEVLNLINKYIEELQKQLNEQKTIQEQEWVSNPKLYGTYTAEYRIQQEQVQSINKRFVAICHAFSDASIGTKQALEQKVKRIFRLVNQSLSDKDVDQIIQTDGIEGLSKMVLQNQNQYQEILETAKEKHEACIRINKSAQEIKQMTLDLATIVHSQSQTIDRIENTVKMAREDVQKGLKNIESANKSSKARKTCMCIGIVVLAIVVIVVLLVVLGIIKGVTGSSTESKSSSDTGSGSTGSTSGGTE